MYSVKESLNIKYSLLFYVNGGAYHPSNFISLTLINKDYRFFIYLHTVPCYT